MVCENFQTYSIQFTGKCICQTPLSPWHDLIISPPCRTPPSYKFAQKCFFPMKCFFKKCPPPYFEDGGTLLMLSRYNFDAVWT